MPASTVSHSGKPLRITQKFNIALLVSSVWFLACLWVSWPWIIDLSQYVGNFLAIFIVSFIALIPGFMQMFVFVSNLIDRRPKSADITQFPPISVLIAAYNEEENILGTIRSVLAQNYHAKIEIIVSDDGSTDNTVNFLESINAKNLVVVQNSHAGKASALNAALKLIKNNIVVVVDADTFLAKDALTEIVKCYLTRPENLAAVAGSVFVKNFGDGVMAGMQRWDFFQSISAVKRMQSLFQGTLVAQGAFSLYRKDLLDEVGGWADCVGEDIVLTWALLKKKYRIGYCEKALCFTNVPCTYKKFFYQRSRWSRGMLEAFRKNPTVLITPRLSLFFIYWNILFPLLDFTYLFVFVPGIILALFGYYFIAGPMTFSLLILGVFYNVSFYRTQKKIFDNVGIPFHFNLSSFVMYILFYQFIMIPACIHGYLSELFNTKKKWTSG